MKPLHGTFDVLTPAESINLLEKGRFAHLACHNGNDIYLVPISYACEGGYIYSHSKPGKKIEMMRKNSHICIQTEEIKNFSNWKSVIALGQFEELKGDEAASGMRLLIKKLSDKDSEGISSLEA